MDNHVHLLVHGESTSIILLMKKIGVSYSGYFNKKYDRVGHLFQDRYRSEPVEDEKYLLDIKHGFNIILFGKFEFFLLKILLYT